MSDEEGLNVRFLLNGAMDAASPLALFLVGQTELWDRLRRKAYTAIRQRIDLKCLVPYLDRAQTAAYVQAHLTYAGTPQPFFADSALDAGRLVGRPGTDLTRGGPRGVDRVWARPRRPDPGPGGPPRGAPGGSHAPSGLCVLALAADGALATVPHRRGRPPPLGGVAVAPPGLAPSSPRPAAGSPPSLRAFSCRPRRDHSPQQFGDTGPRQVSAIKGRQLQYAKRWTPSATVPTVSPSFSAPLPCVSSCGDAMGPMQMRGWITSAVGPGPTAPGQPVPPPPNERRTSPPGRPRPLFVTSHAIRVAATARMGWPGCGPHILPGEVDACGEGPYIYGKGSRRGGTCHALGGPEDRTA